ncbi:hypothetical protein [Sphingomonas sp. GC_Shp_3]|uniref:hypothetical protein n=1 Tax=Sphingomonas sp. GC_Shp_3 TaxID=2937383 RepID=UPI00226A1443|nr:hypothetical protein [Sphingomonas sp. GC_Shp_3]
MVLMKGVTRLSAVPHDKRVRLRADTNRVIAELKTVGENKAGNASKTEQATAKALQKDLTGLVNYVPWWVSDGIGAANLLIR